MQTGAEFSVVVMFEQGTTRKRVPAACATVPNGVPGGISMLTPSTDTSCIIIGVCVALLVSCRSYERLPDALVSHHSSPSASVTFIVGYCWPLTVKYQTAPGKNPPPPAQGCVDPPLSCCVWTTLMPVHEPRRGGSLK